MVKNRTLLSIAGLVWLAAGFNIIRIGILSYQGNVSILNFSISFIIFAIFWYRVFSKLVVKHTTRIGSYEDEKQFFWHFFDVKSFMIMAFMMTFGISIRHFNLMPEACIAVFYTGLGAALSLAGIGFIYNFFRFEDQKSSYDAEEL